jgi:hypothetical protein
MQAFCKKLISFFLLFNKGDFLAESASVFMATRSSFSTDRCCYCEIISDRFGTCNLSVRNTFNFLNDRYLLFSP